MNTKTTYGIIGYPLDHTLSPVMHNAAFKELGVDAIYKPIPLEEDELKVFFNDLHDESNPIFGINVTVPYKEKVIPYLDKLSPLALKLMAVNTVVVNKDRKLIGYNTDAPGFMAHLAELKVETADKRVAIIGAGGAARAIIGTLCLIPERPYSIKIYNRTSARANELLADLSSRIDLSIVETVNSIDDLNIEVADILINTSSIGLKETDPLLVDENTLHSGLFVYDLIYNPKETTLLRVAKEHGAQISNGLGMLFFQGVLALQHWANVPLNDSIKMKMRKALEKSIT